MRFFKPTLWVISLVAILLTSTSPSLAQLRDAPTKEQLNQWESAIKAFELSDKTNPPPRNAVLFIGSSSIRIWKTLEKDFAGHPVLNRGFGGSQVADSVRYVERIVLPYRPKAIFFYAGDNDLHTGKTPQQVAGDFERFVHKVHWALPKTKVFFISIKPSPSRWHHQKSIEAANLLVRAYCRMTDHVEFIDVYHEMLDAEGKPREDLFIKDRLHLNQKGYELWTAIIKPYISRL